MDLHIYLNKELNYMEIFHFHNINKNLTLENSNLNLVLMEKESFLYLVKPFETYDFLGKLSENNNCFIISLNLLKVLSFEFSIFDINTLKDLKTVQIREKTLFYDLLKFCRAFIKNDISSIKLHHQLQLILIELVESLPNNKNSLHNKDGFLYKILQFIKMNPDINLSIEILSKELNISISDIEYTIKKYFDTSFNKFYIQYKLTDSKQFLKGNESIGFTAAKLGFYDQSHFTKYFKKSFAITPGQYKKSMVLL